MRAGIEAALIRGWQTRGALACALWPLGLLHAGIGAARRTAFRAGWLADTRLDRPVVVVGNRIAGGAGKTPTVLALLAHLKARGWHPGVVSRGHGRADGGVLAVTPATPASAVGDEPLLIRLRGDVPVTVGRDRVAAARALLADHPEVDIVVADDGLQHLRLARDVEVVVFDARGRGNGWQLPAGPLREPYDAAPRGRAALVLYNADAPSTPLAGWCARRALAGVLPLDAWWRGERSAPGSLAALRGRPLAACAGIAQPQRFVDTLRDAGLAPTSVLALPDHADYATLPWPADTADVVVTEKDAVKLPPDRVARQSPHARVWVAPLDFQPAPAFLAALDAALAPPPPRREG